MADQAPGERPAGWRKDPTGRHYARYWDGEHWTQHIASAEKVRGVDPQPPPPDPPLFAGESPPPPVPKTEPVAPATSAPTYRGPAPTAPNYQPSAGGNRSRDGGVKVWKIALGVTLGLFLFMGVCVALVAGGADKATKKIQSAGTTPDTAPPASATGPSRDNAPSATTAVTEAALGQSFTVSPGDRKITAFAFKSPVAATNQFTKPKDGMVFAAVEVQECAGPAGERFSPNRFDFELAMADNTRAQAYLEVQQPQLASSPLNPGDCIRGWVSYEIPAAASPKYVVYIAGRSSAKWRIT